MADALCRLPRVLLDGRPAARALLCGSNAHPGLRGEALFYPYQDGTLLLIRALGLPGDGFYACHIQALGDCCTGGDVAFHCAGPHYDPEGREPEPRGRSPVLLSSGGRALSSCIPAGFSPGRCWAGRWYSTLCPMTTAVSQPAAGALPAASSPLPEPGPHGLSCGPGFCSIIYCILFCYPTVTTRTTAPRPVRRCSTRSARP